MSNHPIIAALKAALESERERINTYENYDDGITFSHDERTRFNAGHEAATERLMTVIEKAVEMATDIERGFEADVYGSEWQIDKDDMRQKAREFLTTLADASGERY